MTNRIALYHWGVVRVYTKFLAPTERFEILGIDQAHPPGLSRPSTPDCPSALAIHFYNKHLETPAGHEPPTFEERRIHGVTDCPCVAMKIESD